MGATLTPRPAVSRGPAPPRTCSDRRRAGGLLLALLLATACRSQEVWSGAEFSSDGRTMRLAAEEPMCGCLTLASNGSREVVLQGSFHSITTGEARLLPSDPPLRIKFDWCSPQLGEFYVLRAYDSQSQPLKLRDVVRLEGLDPWRPCDKANCEYGPLLLDLGETTREP